MAEAGLTPSAAEAAGQVADKELGAGFISKQTPLDARMHTDVLPSGALGGAPREPPHALQPEGDGPEVMMEPLRQHDPEERLASIADAQADTDIAAALAHAEAVKRHAEH